MCVSLKDQLDGSELGRNVGLRKEEPRDGIVGQRGDAGFIVTIEARRLTMGMGKAPTDCAE